MSAWPPPRPPRAQISRVPYLPGLDGLRAVAVVAVMVYHANHSWLSGGFLGVEVFFVISGYLITLLLIAEHERSGGKVRLGRFWGRRLRRLLPALFVMLAGLAVYMAIFERAPQGRTRGDFIGGLAYGSNWYQIFVGQGYTAGEAFAPLRHLWSLAVEEQFYLLWPLIMVAILYRGRKHLPRVALWLLGVSVFIAAVTALLYSPGDVATSCSPAQMHGYWTIAGRCININEALYLGTFTRAGGLMLGAGFAMIWRPMAIMRGPLRRRGHRLDLLALVGLAGLGLAMWKLRLSSDGVDLGIRYDPWLFRGGLLFTGVCTLLVIAAVTHQRAWAGKVLGNPVFNWVGTRSYGLYLYHWPIYQIIRKQAGLTLTPAEFGLAMVITVVVTELSYRLVEAPIRRGRFGEWLRGERAAQTSTVYARRRRAIGAAVLAAATVCGAGVSIATADNICVGDVECSLVGAGTVPTVSVPTVSTPTVIAPTVTAADSIPSSLGGSTAAQPSTTQQPSTQQPSSTTVPPAGVPVVTGETGSTVLTETPAATTQPGVVESTTPITTTATAAPVLTVAPDTVSPADLPPLAVGESVMQGAAPVLAAAGLAVSADQSRQGGDIAAILEAFRAAGQMPQTVIVQSGTNGTVSDETYDRMMASLPAASTPHVYFLTVRAPKGWIDGNNQRILALPGRYPNVTIIDWATASVVGEVSLCSDGIHIACGNGAAQFYANLIFDSIGRPELKR